MTDLKIILVEDDQKKIDDIKGFLDESFGYSDLTIRQSYQSGLRELLTNQFNFLLLDMSIPTWDKEPNKSSGDFQKFGGYTILQELDRKNKMIPVALISMFDEFGESDRSVTLRQIDSMLNDEYSEYYHGAIYYSSSQSDWKEKLKNMICDCLL
ncbi:response regulator [Fodinibius sediminis]|uniref:Response regulator receiver protein n=1 Tax=Fodinibius sediminis TaxID=1214077 RepID=A0A521FFN1_9BACT|nr:response regulator [Fodinibius sediminis]SMO94784.1 response regulator receiver protein [Fodinibius sediminis]